MNKHGSMAATAAVASAMFCCAASAATLDLLPLGSFSLTLSPLNAGGNATQQSPAPVLGSYRELRIEGTKGTGAKLSVSNPGFHLTSGTLSTTSAYYILDGAQFNSPFSPLSPDVDGLGTDGNGEDLVALSGGGDRFRLNVSEVTGSFAVSIRVWCDGGSYEFELTQNAVDSSGPLEYRFADFPGVDFTDVSALVFTIDANTADSQITISEFLVTGATSLLGDCDADGDVDLDDYGGFESCLFGPVGGPGPGCACFDLDADGDVDLADYQLFQAIFTGPLP